MKFPSSRSRWVLAVAAAWFLQAGALAAPVLPGQTLGLDEILGMARSGAPGLALTLMDQAQQRLIQRPDEWIRWEQERIRLLGHRGDWKGIAARIDAAPDDVPPGFINWLRVQRIAALLELGEARTARAELLPLLWEQVGTSNRREVAHLRRLVIRSYLTEGRVDDAYTAMLRYRQDYGDDGPEGALLRARVLMLKGLPGDAAEALAGQADQPEGQAMRLLAQLRSGALPPERVVALGTQLVTGAAEWQRAGIWATVAEAAERTGDPGMLANALEHVVAAKAWHPMWEGLFDYRADSLWEAYLAYAVGVGNRAQLLVGDDPAWLAAAAQAGKRYPVRARSLTALLALRGRSADQRRAAHQDLARQLMARGSGMELLSALYLTSRRYPTEDEIPEVVRYLLIDHALKTSDITLASRLMANLSEPPEGADKITWHLQRAKALILAGDAERGARVLSELIRTEPAMEGGQVDRTLQVVFDLQTVGEHDAAYRLFEALLRRSNEPQIQREILYWMADSRLAQERYAEAGWLYLRSATLHSAQAMDPWAQTARYQAAGALGKAGLTHDARTLYEALLDVTSDPGRRAVLQRDIQQLSLSRQ